MRSLLPTHYRDKYEILGMADKTHSGLLLCMRHETIGQILDSADSILHFDIVIQISGGGGGEAAIPCNCASNMQDKGREAGKWMLTHRTSPV